MSVKSHFLFLSVCLSTFISLYLSYLLSFFRFSFSLSLSLSPSLSLSASLSLCCLSPSLPQIITQMHCCWSLVYINVCAQRISRSFWGDTDIVVVPLTERPYSYLF